MANLKTPKGKRKVSPRRTRSMGGNRTITTAKKVDTPATPDVITQAREKGATPGTKRKKKQTPA
eukprot:CAMPEP_0197826614 /NCGR_PEP_ID=MMETSP1437-20131217/3557_1 /TAXON_ID=49252 ORGANISM="Eucampia antarctica, Strain CCMP1452" /NCGR_SAMPLE_ID=MMETSP1437 /ASSEMBLY_ACC=CAM_ASM_001096 /LENGTH=63 /DNA_ID=CAMNT_0043427129 /DNA_START=17 /DNA_END=204 /DNA_ORIENTATION=+